MTDEMLDSTYQVALDYYRYVDAGDIENLVRLFETDAVYSRPGYPAMVGRAAIERFYRSERVIRHGSHTLECGITSSTGVAVHGSFNGTLVDGREKSVRFADFFELSPRLLVRARRTFFFAPAV